MSRLLSVLFSLPLALCFAGCANVSPLANSKILVTITDPFTNDAIQVGTAAVTLNATVANDPSHAGVKWGLTA